MRIYRVSQETNIYCGVDEGHGGYKYFGSKAETLRALAEIRKEGNDASYDLIEVVPTKTGIIQALNFFGGHPDNG